jgi:hypothetical protein
MPLLQQVPYSAVDKPVCALLTLRPVAKYRKLHQLNCLCYVCFMMVTVVCGLVDCQLVAVVCQDWSSSAFRRRGGLQQLQRTSNSTRGTSAACHFINGPQSVYGHRVRPCAAMLFLNFWKLMCMSVQRFHDGVLGMLERS